MVMSEIKSSFLIIDFSSAEKKCGNRNVPGQSDKGRNNENRKKRIRDSTLADKGVLHS